MKLDSKRMLFLLSLTLPNFWVFNYLIASVYFFRGNRRLPRSAGAANATINDFIFHRMIANKWSLLQQFCVDKEYSKIHACHSARVKAAKTIAIYRIDANESAKDFVAWLKPFLGRRLIAKPTHGSGRVLFLDRSENEAAIRDFFSYCKTNFFYVVRETQYKNLERKIIIEENISRADNINDYKFFCARGQVLYCQVDVDRFIDHKRALCSVPDFVTLPVESKYKIPAGLQKPAKFNEMIEIASVLSKDFDFVRVDLYLVEDGIYFGEYTFSPDAACARLSSEAFGIEALRKVRSRLSNHACAA
jgi:hypothetical protein